MMNDFELTKIVISSLSIKVRRLYRQLKNSTPIKVEKRVAAKLWKLSKDYGIEVEDGTVIDMNISITYLADMFGAPRETISRALKILQDKDCDNNNNCERRKRCSMKSLIKLHLLLKQRLNF